MRSHNRSMACTILATPHFVRLSVPDRGFGDDLDAMVLFYLERGEELRTGCLPADHRNWIYFCFRHAKNAEDFAKRFSGESFQPAVMFSCE